MSKANVSHIISSLSEESAQNLKIILGNNNIGMMNEIISKIIPESSLSKLSDQEVSDKLQYLQILTYLISQEYAAINEIRNAVNNNYDLRQLATMQVLFESGYYSLGLPGGSQYFPKMEKQSVKNIKVASMLSRVYTQSSKSFFTEAPNVIPQRTYKDKSNIIENLEEIFNIVVSELENTSPQLRYLYYDNYLKNTANAGKSFKEFMVSLIREFFRSLVDEDTNTIKLEQFIIIDDDFPEKLYKILPRVNLVMNYSIGMQKAFHDAYQAPLTAFWVNGSYDYMLGSSTDFIEAPYLNIKYSSTNNIYEHMYPCAALFENPYINLRYWMYRYPIEYENKNPGKDYTFGYVDNKFLGLQQFLILFFKRISEGTINYKIL